MSPPPTPVTEADSVFKVLTTAAGTAYKIIVSAVSKHVFDTKRYYISIMNGRASIAGKDDSGMKLQALSRFVWPHEIPDSKSLLPSLLCLLSDWS